MEKYIEKLDELLQVKGKDPNENQKTQYYTCFFSMLSENGLDETAFEYMDKGFRFIKMRPFKVFFTRAESEKKPEILKRLFDSRFFNKDRGRTFSILVNLLAHFLSDNKVDDAYVRIIIKKIPEYCFNKDGEIQKNASSIILNSFYPDLLNINTNCEYDELFDDDNTRDIFERLIYESIQYAESRVKPNARQKKGIELVKDWIPSSGGGTVALENELPEKMSETSENPVTSLTEFAHVSFNDVMSNTDNSEVGAGPVLPVNNNNVAVDGDETANEENGFEDRQKVKNSKDSTEEKAIPGFLINMFNKLVELNTSVQRNNSITTALMNDYRKLIDSLSGSIEREKSNSEYIRRQNIELLTRNEILQKEVENLRVQIDQKDAEIDSIKAMSDLMEREDVRQYEERISRVSEKLRIEYEDYKSADSIPMSVELGENLRDQLGDIFDILQKEGFNIKDI